jgi:hypothetical protein
MPKTIDNSSLPSRTYMDLQELKEKFRHKTKADLSDIDTALQAVPFLVRKVEELETELAECEKRFQHLSSQRIKQRSLSSKGKKDGVEWEVKLDEKKNQLFMRFSGEINPRIAKFASNSLSPVLTNIRKGCNVVNDVSTLTNINNRVMFHFRKILYTLDMMGIERIIHVTQPEDTSVLSAFQSASDSLGYQVIIAHSPEEAKSILEKSVRFLKV